MRPHSIILDLPPELIHVVLESCRSLSDLHSLSGSCQHLRNIFIAKKVYYYDTILRRTLPAFEDALRTQRASVSSIRHLTHLGYASNNLQSMLPPIGTELIDTPTICRFDIDKGEYINIPTENDIVKLGTTPIASAWEVQHVVQLHKIVSKCLHLARCGQIDMWFTHVRVWPIEMEERFYRGAYRYWMFGHLFYPGCYMEPFIVERERLDDATLPRFGEQWSFSDGQQWEMEKYPLFIPDLNSNLRKKHVERLFDGFIAWIVYDAEERAGNKQARGLQMRYSPHLRSGRRRNPPVDPGGVAELLLIHTMSMCLDELAARRNREPGIAITMLEYQSSTILLTGTKQQKYRRQNSPPSTLLETGRSESGRLRRTEMIPILPLSD